MQHLLASVFLALYDCIANSPEISPQLLLQTTASSPLTPARSQIPELLVEPMLLLLTICFLLWDKSSTDWQLIPSLPLSFIRHQHPWQLGVWRCHHMTMIWSLFSFVKFTNPFGQLLRVVIVVQVCLKYMKKFLPKKGDLCRKLGQWLDFALLWASFWPSR